VKVAFDTNVLAYAEGVDTDAQRDAAHALLKRLPEDARVVPVQVLGELFNVLVRKGRRSREEAYARVLAWSDSCDLVETTPAVLLRAAELAVDHQLFIWDAVILSAAAEAECRLLLSEDMHDGFTWGGVTVTNPFATPQHVLLDALLEGE